jgi:Putative transposase of IS4/5 family (DUF4096)
LLSCRIPVQESAPGVSCCRLSLAHKADQPRTRRYPSDTTDAQWALIDPLLPDPAWLAGRGGRPETHCRRQIVDAIFYLVDNGIKWRALPADLPVLLQNSATWIDLRISCVHDLDSCACR